MSSNILENEIPPLRTAADRLLLELKTKGPQTAAELGILLGVSAEAARQQLVKLAAEGAVVGTAEPKGVGRPAQLWKLSASVASRFPNAHAELTVQLIGSIRTVLGEQALEKLISARETGIRGNYEKMLEGRTSVADRVAALADLRKGEGYMAEWEQTDRGYRLIENHCPICVAAESCQELCRSELRTYQSLLGSEVDVTRSEHIVGGERRCVYEIIPVTADKD